MTPSKFIILIFGVLFSWSLDAAINRKSAQESTQDHFNIPIRVLLERLSFSARVTSLSGDLEVRALGQKTWTVVGKSALISTEQLPRKMNRFLINGTPWPAEHLYLKSTLSDGMLMFRANVYRGVLRLSITDKGMPLVTNVVPLSDYLMGTLVGEMEPGWELEALKAQAVAARTYALYMKDHPKSPYYELEDGSIDQVYIGRKDFPQRIRQAVESTEGLVLMSNRKPVKAYYHSRCGGSTDAAQMVWARPPKKNLRNIACPYCATNPNPWRTQYPIVALLEGAKLPTTTNSRLEITHKAPSGRVTDLKLSAGNTHRVISSEELRRQIGYSKLKSAYFNLEVEDGQLQFSGVGSGHGVGMCQWGARHLAKTGKSFNEILAHYYPDATLNKLNARETKRF